MKRLIYPVVGAEPTYEADKRLIPVQAAFFQGMRGWPNADGIRQMQYTPALIYPHPARNQ